MTKEEFISLYEKFLNGQCSPMEKELLNAYRDEMKLLDNKWEEDFLEGQKTHARIWGRLENSIKPGTIVKPVKSFGWLKVAATILIALSAGLGAYNYLGKS